MGIFERSNMWGEEKNHAGPLYCACKLQKRLVVAQSEKQNSNSKSLSHNNNGLKQGTAKPRPPIFAAQKLHTRIFLDPYTHLLSRTRNQHVALSQRLEGSFHGRLYGPLRHRRVARHRLEGASKTDLYHVRRRLFRRRPSCRRLCPSSRR